MRHLTERKSALKAALSDIEWSVIYITANYLSQPYCVRMSMQRVDEILKELQALVREGKRLIQEHKKLVGEYERLKDELDTLNGRQPSKTCQYERSTKSNGTRGDALT